MTDSSASPRPAHPAAALLPAMDRYAELLGAYAAPGESLLDAAGRMTPADLAERLEPVLGPRLAAASAA